MRRTSRAAALECKRGGAECDLRGCLDYGHCEWPSCHAVARHRPTRLPLWVCYNHSDAAVERASDEERAGRLADLSAACVVLEAGAPEREDDEPVEPGDLFAECLS